MVEIQILEGPHKFIDMEQHFVVGTLFSDGAADQVSAVGGAEDVGDDRQGVAYPGVVVLAEREEAGQLEAGLAGLSEGGQRFRADLSVGQFGDEEQIAQRLDEASEGRPVEHEPVDHELLVLGRRVLRAQTAH